MESLRLKVDKIDSKILSLLNKRAKTVCRIARTKKNSKYKDISREKQIKIQLIKMNEGPLESKHISYIYDEIFDAMVDIQEVEPLI